MGTSKLRASIGLAALGLLIWVTTQIIVGKSLSDMAVNPLTIGISIILI